MLIKDLPEVIKKRAIECQKEQGNECNESANINSTNDAFDWLATKEGHSLWNKVNDGNFQPFYDFHGIKPEWVPKEGEIVLCNVHPDGENDWVAQYFVGMFNNLYVCVSTSTHNATCWPYCRKFVNRLTRAEIAERFGVNNDFEFVEE